MQLPGSTAGRRCDVGKTRLFCRLLHYLLASAGGCFLSGSFVLGNDGGGLFRVLGDPQRQGMNLIGACRVRPLGKSHTLFLRDDAFQRAKNNTTGSVLVEASRQNEVAATDGPPILEHGCDIDRCGALGDRCEARESGGECPDDCAYCARNRVQKRVVLWNGFAVETETGLRRFVFFKLEGAPGLSIQHLKTAARHYFKKGGERRGNEYAIRREDMTFQNGVAYKASGATREEAGGGLVFRDDATGDAYAGYQYEGSDADVTARMSDLLGLGESEKEEAAEESRLYGAYVRTRDEFFVPTAIADALVAMTLSHGGSEAWASNPFGDGPGADPGGMGGDGPGADPGGMGGDGPGADPGGMGGHSGGGGRPGGEPPRPRGVFIGRGGKTGGMGLLAQVYRATAGGGAEGPVGVEPSPDDLDSLVVDFLKYAREEHPRAAVFNPAGKSFCDMAALTPMTKNAVAQDARDMALLLIVKAARDGDEASKQCLAGFMRRNITPLNFLCSVDLKAMDDESRHDKSLGDLSSDKSPCVANEYGAVVSAILQEHRLEPEMYEGILQGIRKKLSVGGEEEFNGFGSDDEEEFKGFGSDDEEPFKGFGGGSGGVTPAEAAVGVLAGVATVFVTTLLSTMR